MRAPGFEPGLLRSTTTQRDGFVNLVDVAPTVLTYFGLDRPDAMEGRRMETGEAGGSLADHRDFLVNINEDGLFRDGLVGPVDERRDGARDRPGARRPSPSTGGRACGRGGPSACSCSARSGCSGSSTPPTSRDRSTSVATAGSARGGRSSSGSARVIAAVCMLADRRRPVLAVLAGLGTMVALHLVDLVTGAHLEWNTVFGYSPTIGIRFVGQGNMTFAQLTAAAVLFAGLLAWQVPTRRGMRIAIALLAVTVIVMGAPFWGNDFGGAVSAAPGFALLAWLLLGHELRWRTVWVLVGVLVAAGLVVGAGRRAAPVRPTHARGQVLREGRHRLRRARRSCSGARPPRTCRCSGTRCSSAA